MPTRWKCLRNQCVRGFLSNKRRFEIARYVKCKPKPASCSTQIMSVSLGEDSISLLEIFRLHTAFLFEVRMNHHWKGIFQSFLSRPLCSMYLSPTRRFSRGPQTNRRLTVPKLNFVCKADIQISTGSPCKDIPALRLVKFIKKFKTRVKNMKIDKIVAFE